MSRKSLTAIRRRRTVAIVAGTAIVLALGVSSSFAIGRNHGGPRPHHGSGHSRPHPSATATTAPTPTVAPTTETPGTDEPTSTSPGDETPGDETATATTAPSSSTTTTTSPAGDASFWGSTSDIPAAQNVLQVKVLNKTNGKYPDSQVYWTFNGQTHSIAEQPYVDMPANAAGRMTFHLGSPDSKYNDFIEFTVGDNVFNGNTTRVDAFGLKLAMLLHNDDGSEQEVGENRATFAESREATFGRFAAAVPAEFKHLASGTDRIVSPGGDSAFAAGGQYADYMNSYASSVGSNATTQQIFGCSGPLANDAAGCANLNRHVADLPQTDWSTPSSYYKKAPANYYAEFWHDNAIDAKAYGFPYDDYASQSSYISHTDPKYLLVAVGW
ncbi:glycoside hydrolase family 64 protein [Kineosporia sp. NBRC 101731]|uniref:glycoside hydrolase family 64 protein n=1 Tax=Kineosporia sp. NBRC 101731 TaxID=3032199 RepID=UPI0024A0F14D|nr:glycoside hydrolase family 64 protein [Kineosporia sp. NBRC 101731]GLY28119.1 hypothetical protein Kisp02_14840 [Kineosporia sp. NBRC 101731]